MPISATRGARRTAPPDDVLRDLPHDPRRARDAVFEHVTGLAASAAVAIVMRDDPVAAVPGAPVKVVADRLAGLLGIRKADATRLMGVS